ncbi:Os10g0528651 [Oryza sativa Japonica Group]|uniref:Os10g0528651 protein n=1 Tax=Oryza sativa subsp. japonica TaxID=39947 RepID=A0A0P0XWH3_ORYSJ|nr:Os10g0528651 [Oryza sativa Japonica Group]
MLAQLVAAAAHSACFILAYSASLPVSGNTALAASSAAKRSSHASRSGLRLASNSLIPCTASPTRTNPITAPSVTSTYPTASPPKKGFPLEHSLNAASRFATAANVSFIAAAFSCSVLHIDACSHDFNSCNNDAHTTHQFISSFSIRCKFKTIGLRQFVDYLVVDVGGPEASDGTVVGVGWEERNAGVGERLVDVLHDDLRLADGLAVVDEHGYLLVHRVGGEKQLALVLEILLDVLVAQALEAERELRSQRERARPHPQQLQLISSTGHCLPL